MKQGYVVHTTGSLESSPQVEIRRGVRAMKIMNFCYVALGIAVARWIFKRQPVRVTDPVPRLRTSGLL